MRTPNILTIAGSDSGGGAGIQADLKTIMALDGYGMSVITALTAQNGLGVTGIHAPEPEFVVLQLRAVLDGFPVHAAKTGMLFSAGIINALADALRDRSFPLVVDPVSVSQSGSRLLREDAVEALKERMIPGCDLLTPNRPEAEMLTGMTISCADDAAAAGEALIRMGAKAVLHQGRPYGKLHRGHGLPLPGRTGAQVPAPAQGGDQQQPRHRLHPVGRHRHRPWPRPAPAGGRDPRPGIPQPCPAQELRARQGLWARQPRRPPPSIIAKLTGGKGCGKGTSCA